jgi:hypothetical protein
MQANSGYRMAVRIAQLDLKKPIARGEVEPLLGDVTDWPATLKTLFDQGVFMLFYRALEQAEALDLLGEETAEQAKSIRRYLDDTAALQEAALGAALRVLNDARVPALLPKGLWLDRFVYATPGSRYSYDIDIYVHDGDLDRASAALADSGFRRVANKHGIGLVYQSGEIPVLLELQTFRRPQKAKFRETYLWDPKELWGRATEQRFGGATFLALRAEDLLVFLAVHLAERHHFERLIWIRDIREIVNHYAASLDWQIVIDTAKRWRCATYVYFTLRLAQDLAGAAIPQDVLEQLRPRYWSGIAFQRTLWAEDLPRLPIPTQSWRYQLFTILGDNWSRRLWAQLLLPYHALQRRPRNA